MEHGVVTAIGFEDYSLCLFKFFTHFPIKL